MQDPVNYHFSYSSNWNLVEYLSTVKWGEGGGGLRLIQPFTNAAPFYNKTNKWFLINLLRT